MDKPENRAGGQVSPSAGNFGDEPTPSLRPPKRDTSRDTLLDAPPVPERIPELPSLPGAAFPEEPTPDLRSPRDPSTPPMARGGQVDPRRGRTLIQYTPPGALSPAAARVPSDHTPPPEPGPAPMIQGKPFGRYLLTGLLAQGGMARVHHALLRDESGFEKPLAIKCMRRELSQDPEFVRRFVDEARIASTLGHSNIVQVFDFGQAQGRYFLAMELVQGPDLGSLLDRLAKAGRSMPVPAVLQVAAGALRGLGAAHRRVDAAGNAAAVVHRDMSPQNILISLTGEVKVADFGIAKAASNLVQTRAGIVMGKFFYMSPEQAMGLPVDPRSDIFSMGAVLYEMLSGRPLWSGGSPEELVRQVISAPMPDLSHLGGPDAPELGHILKRVLSREHDERPEDGNTLARELERLLHRLSPGYSRDDLADLVRQVEGVPNLARTLPVVAAPAFREGEEESPSLDELRQRWPEHTPLDSDVAPDQEVDGASGVEVAREETLVHPLEDSSGSSPTPLAEAPEKIRPRWHGQALALTLALLLGVGAGVGLASSGRGPEKRRLAPGATVSHGPWSLSLKAASLVPNTATPRFQVELWLGHPEGLKPESGRMFSLRGKPALFWTTAEVQGETILRLVFGGKPSPVLFAPPGEAPAQLDLAF